MCSAASENKLQIDFAFSSSLITRLRNFLAAHNPSMNIHIANVSIERSLSVSCFHPLNQLAIQFSFYMNKSKNKNKQQAQDQQPTARA